MARVNRQITLAARPVGFPRVSDFNLVYTPVPSPGAGEVLVRSVYLSLDAWLRGRMNEAGSRARPLDLGEVMAGGVVGLVVESMAPELRAGDVVEGPLGWQEYAVAPGRELRKIDPGLAPISTALGVLGTPGLTAYFGLLEICDPQPGETVVVSGAAGAIGTLAAQIAKLRGCRVVGLAGSNGRASWLLDELGLDAFIHYEAEADLLAGLEAHCPGGIDVYFDNVGGATTDAVLRRINTGARISVCGQISQDNLEEPEVGPRWLEQVVAKQARIQGFLVSAYAERFPEALEQLSTWLAQRKLKYREDVAQGIEAAPQAFIRMLQGRNHGKQLVHLPES
ncbi:MAG: NADP-dependent oxidoreductase [Thermoanaerobaculia bacterium]|nr:MAG: NADP-dependent oxidoreductase [Thermoanaerobaculia bacterium]